FLGRGCARADICEVLAHPHFSKEYRPIENVIARRAAAITPFSFDVIGGIVGADLLAVAINAAVGRVNSYAALEHSRLRPRIDVGAFLFGFRIEMSALPY